LLHLELSKDAAPALVESYQDMRSHLAELIYDHFITQTPPDWLVHYPRFLQAIEVRLRKLHSAGLARDRSTIYQIAPLLRAYHERRAQHRQLAVVDPELEHYWWMLQEYRVSLFAQELKTSIPISLKRLETQWAKVKR
jgi:ATP-dependent helicase HrpA